MSKSVKLHGILFSLCTKSCKKPKVFEKEDRNTNGVQKKAKANGNVDCLLLVTEGKVSEKYGKSLELLVSDELQPC